MPARTKSRKPPTAGPPYVGALLRLAWRQVRDHMHAAMRKAGFDDLQEAHFPAFAYPLPAGTRPSDFARQLGISRQAANHLLSQMEQLGYFERRAAAPGARRLIYLTPRGRRVADTIYGSLRELQSQWASSIGERRFAEFMTVLRTLADLPSQ